FQHPPNNIFKVIRGSTPGRQSVSSDLEVVLTEGRYRCYAKKTKSSDYQLLRDYHLMAFTERPLPPELIEVRIRRSEPREIFVKWKVEWLVYNRSTARIGAVLAA
ncbi:hypothetical protein OSTOST_02079, partial [Ostertagia ostertagi]